MADLQHQGVSASISKAHKVSDWLIRIVLPIGWLVLLTGLFWIGERPNYHKLYYMLLAAPTLLALLLRPSLLKGLLASPLVIAFVLFSIYTVATLAWSSTDDPAGSLVKRPIYILFLFFSAGLLAQLAPARLQLSLRASALVASIAGLLSVALYLYNATPGRLSGYGALYNPLLTSHVYGFFLAYWAASWFQHRNPMDPLSLVSIGILASLIMATGSRTPLAALAASMIWLALAYPKRRSLVALMIMALAGATLVVIYPESLTSRGLSYRPEIWEKTWLQILQSPWFGHGFDAPMKIKVTGLELVMADPHNMLLAVLYYCGFIGLALWLLMYGIALIFSWKNRKSPLVLFASTLLIFGFTATMTEGGSFLSRPKEHWFLIWIPMALLVAADMVSRKRRKAQDSTVAT